MENILKMYDLIPPIKWSPFFESGENNALYQVQTGAGTFVWKTYTGPSYADPAALRYEQTLLQSLAQRELSFSLPCPLVNREGQALFHTPQGWSVLLPYFPGTRLNPHNHAEITALGHMLGELHTLLGEYPVTVRPGRHVFDLFFDFPRPAYDPLSLTPTHLGVSNDKSNRDLLAWWCEEAAELQHFLDTRYTDLPWQICHNDVAPNNVLIEQGRVSVLLDFEFITPAPRALDVAMALRMTMRTWENPEPWEAICAFFGGYAQWVTMTEHEIQVFPWLLRLRSVVSLLWALGRQSNLYRIPTTIQYYRNCVQWLQKYEERFLDRVQREALRK